MRRFLVVAAVWLGLLGMAEPLLACAMNTPASSCCTTDTQTACEHESGQGISTSDQVLCCAAAPVGQPLVVLIKKGDAKPPYEASGNADLPLITSSSLHGTLAPVPRHAFRPRFSDNARRLGAETYLRTGRLRL